MKGRAIKDYFETTALLEVRWNAFWPARRHPWVQAWGIILAKTSREVSGGGKVCYRPWHQTFHGLSCPNHERGLRESSAANGGRDPPPPFPTPLGRDFLLTHQDGAFTSPEMKPPTRFQLLTHHSINRIVGRWLSSPALPMEPTQDQPGVGGGAGSCAPRDRRMCTPRI